MVPHPGDSNTFFMNGVAIKVEGLILSVVQAIPYGIVFWVLGDYQVVIKLVCWIGIWRYVSKYLNMWLYVIICANIALYIPIYPYIPYIFPYI